MEFIIKKAETMGDFAGISALARRVWHDTYDGLIGAEQTGYMLEKFQSPEKIARDVENEGYVYAMAMAGETLAGYCGVQPREDGRVFLSKLYVAPEWQRRGAARALAEHFAREYAQKGYTRMWLTVNRGNQRAIAAYERLGFSVSGTLVTDIGQGYVMDDYTMETEL